METAVRRSGKGFLRKTFTDAELAYCAGRAEKLAGRWAAKEAVIKCFAGTPLCLPRRRIEVVAGSSGAPQVRLLGADQRADVQVSITHGAGIAIVRRERPHNAAVDSHHPDFIGAIRLRAVVVTGECHRAAVG